MDRINHVKIVSPDPEAIDRFLREVVQIPEGWQLGDPPEGYEAPAVVSPARDADGNFTVDSVHDFRGASGFGGLITGSTESRQFQILTSDTPLVWAICIGTRYIERAHERCQERGIPATEITVADWNERDNIRNFFCVVGGIMFEVIRVEPKEK